MKHLWSGVAVAAILAAAMLSGPPTASAQAPLSPSGAVNNPEPSGINFPGAASSPSPAPSPAPTETARTPAAAAPIPPATETVSTPAPAAPSAAPEQAETRPSAAAPPAQREAVVGHSRPKRPVRSADRAEVRLAASRGGRYPGDDVADSLNARELNGLGDNPGPGPVAHPYGPSPGYGSPQG